MTRSGERRSTHAARTRQDQRGDVACVRWDDSRSGRISAFERSRILCAAGQVRRSSYLRRPRKRRQTDALHEQRRSALRYLPQNRPPFRRHRYCGGRSRRRQGGLCVIDIPSRARWASQSAGARREALPSPRESCQKFVCKAVQSASERESSASSCAPRSAAPSGRTGWPSARNSPHVGPMRVSLHGKSWRNALSKSLSSVPAGHAAASRRRQRRNQIVCDGSIFRLNRKPQRGGGVASGFSRKVRAPHPSLLQSRAAQPLGSL